VTVTVKQPEATHHVKIGDFQKWLNARGKKPKDMTDRQRIREILGDSRQRAMPSESLARRPGQTQVQDAQTTKLRRGCGRR
jgi:hypothetical protein